MTVPYIDLRRQHDPLREDIQAAVARVLDHGQFILGPEVAQLEAALSERLGVHAVVAVKSGTDALRLALQVHGVGAGDEVITVSHTFLGTAAAIVSVGATPVFVDLQPDSLTIDPKQIEAALTERTRAIIAVHLGGIPADLGPIQALCVKNGLALIEDCAQAIGAHYQGTHVGSVGTGCFSLHPIKSLGACGDGGFVSLGDEAVTQRLRLLRNNGLVDRDHCTAISGHSRLDTLQAAILLVKLRHLDDWLAQRQAHAEAYRAGLGEFFPLLIPPAQSLPAYSSFVIRTDNRRALMAHASAAGFDLKVHYPVPVHLQPPYERFSRGPLPITEKAVQRIVSLPVSPELSSADRDALIECLQTFAGKANA